MGERLVANRTALGPMPTRTQQWRAPNCRCPGPNCPAPSAAPSTTPHLLCDYCRRDANAGTSWRSVVDVRHRPQASTNDRQRLPSDENVMCITLRASALRDPTRQLCAPSAGLAASTATLRSNRQCNSHSQESRIIDGMGKPRRRSTQRARQAGSSRTHRTPGDTTGSAQRPSQRTTAEVLERLKRARSARDAAEAQLDALIDRAVALGIGWGPRSRSSLV